MSSRQLRKLQKQRELQEANAPPAPESDDSSDGEDPAPAPAAKPRVSLFAALGGDEEEDGDQQEEDQDEDGDSHQPQDSKTDDLSQPTQPAKKGKKKKKKKNKDKATAGTVAEDDDQDEIDKAIEELKISGQQRGVSSTDGESRTATRRINDLLSINNYHLKAINEMRNLFGRDVIESADAEEGQETNRRQRGRVQQQVDLETFLRGPPGAKKLPEVSLRRNVFIQGREHWPRQTAGGLTMKQVHKAEDGSHTEYTYAHDNQYDAVQAFFFSCVQIGDPMRMVYLLQQVRESYLLQTTTI